MPIQFAPDVLSKKVLLSPQVVEPPALRRIMFDDGSAQTVVWSRNWLRQEHQQLFLTADEMEEIIDFYNATESAWFSYYRPDIGWVWMRFYGNPRNAQLRDTAALYWNLSLTLERYADGVSNRWQGDEVLVNQLYSLQAVAAGFGQPEADDPRFNFGLAIADRRMPNEQDGEAGALFLIDGGEFIIDADSVIDEKLVIAANAQLAMLYNADDERAHLLPIGGVSVPQNFIAQVGFNDAAAEIRNGTYELNGVNVAGEIIEQANPVWNVLRGRFGVRSSVLAQVGNAGQSQISNTINNSIATISHDNVSSNAAGELVYEGGNSVVTVNIPENLLTDDMMLVAIAQIKSDSATITNTSDLVSILANGPKATFGIAPGGIFTQTLNPNFNDFSLDNFADINENYLTLAVVIRPSREVLFFINDGTRFERSQWQPLSQTTDWYSSVTRINFGGNGFTGRIQSATAFICHARGITADELMQLQIAEIDSSIRDIAVLGVSEYAPPARVTRWANAENTERNLYRLIKKGRLA